MAVASKFLLKAARPAGNGQHMKGRIQKTWADWISVLVAAWCSRDVATELSGKERFVGVGDEVEQGPMP